MPDSACAIMNLMTTVSHLLVRSNITEGQFGRRKPPMFIVRFKPHPCAEQPPKIKFVYQTAECFIEDKSSAMS